MNYKDFNVQEFLNYLDYLILGDLQQDYKIDEYRGWQGNVQKVAADSSSQSNLELREKLLEYFNKGISVAQSARMLGVSDGIARAIKQSLINEGRINERFLRPIPTKTEDMPQSTGRDVKKKKTFLQKSREKKEIVLLYNCFKKDAV